MSETRAAFLPAAAPAAKVHELLLAAARVTPQAPAVIDYTDSGELNTMTYRPLESLAVACATEMDRLGPDIGDRVLVEADTRPSDRHVPRLLDARCHLRPGQPGHPRPAAALGPGHLRGRTPHARRRGRAGLPAWFGRDGTVRHDQIDGRAGAHAPYPAPSRCGHHRHRLHDLHVRPLRFLQCLADTRATPGRRGPLDPASGAMAGARTARLHPPRGGRTGRVISQAGNGELSN